MEVTRCGVTGALSVTFVSAKAMEKANAHLVGHEGLTDVITFDYRMEGFPLLPEEGVSAGEEIPCEVDLIVCPEAAFRESRKRNIPYCRELALYVVHGLLHSAGFDDLKPELKRKMRRQEKITLDELEKSLRFEEIFPEPVLMEDDR